MRIPVWIGRARETEVNVRPRRPQSPRENYTWSSKTYRKIFVRLFHDKLIQGDVHGA